MQNWISTRRELIGKSVGGTLGLALGFSLPWIARNAVAGPQTREAASNVLNTFVRIFADNRIQIAVVKAEMGQGVSTSMAMLIADEMDADWSLVEVRLEGEMAPYTDPKGGLAATFGSTSTRTQYLRLRQIGADVRELLLNAAATQLGKAKTELRTQKSWITDAAGQRLLSFGQLLETAAKIPLPATAAPLKTKDQFQLIGQRVLRKDVPAKIEGQAAYGMDIRLPGLKYAAIKQHKAFGSTLSNFAALQAEIPAGYTLIEIPGAIILIGASYWQAQKILDKLPVQYASTPAIDGINQASIEQNISAAVQNFSGASVAKKGDGIGALGLCESFVEAEYFAPFLAHNALEPLCCTAWVDATRCEFWIPTQSAQLCSFAIAKAIGRPPNQIKINVTYLGGGFGRKVETDYVTQAALAAQAVQGPVQLIWSRAEDTQHDFYRPAFAAKFKAGIDAQRLRVWIGKNAGSSIMKRQNPATVTDFTSIDGFADLPYAVDHQEIYSQIVDTGVPVGYWRSVGKSQNSFFVESFFDEVAAQLQADPLQLRKDLLGAHPRAVKVLDRLAEVSGWFTSPDRQRMGMAYSEAFGSFAAMAALVSVQDGKLKVEQLWSVVDCGQVVNPVGAEAQVQGAALFCLAAALYGKITLTQGKVDQSIFGDRPLLRLGDTPKLSTSFVESGEAVGGLGEVTTPLAAPAVCNAIFRATGRRIRRLPLSEVSWS